MATTYLAKTDQFIAFQAATILRDLTCRNLWLFYAFCFYF